MNNSGYTIGLGKEALKKIIIEYMFKTDNDVCMLPKEINDLCDSVLIITAIMKRLGMTMLLTDADDKTFKRRRPIGEAFNTKDMETGLDEFLSKYFVI